MAGPDRPMPVTGECVTADDIDRAASPGLRKKLEAARDFARHISAHPVDPRPMRAAMASGDIGRAVALALQYGLDVGRLAGEFGTAARRGREHDGYLASARGARAEMEAKKKAEWQSLADALWAERHDRTKIKTARLIREHLKAIGADPKKKVPSAKRIADVIRKPT